jgi:hypothetical protein
MLNHPSNYNE